MGKRVLSIQSHVVSGYVGNKSATFPLQLLGVDVDPLNTVQFSNHSGYPQFLGKRISEESLKDLLKGLTENGFLPGYSHILCGYMGKAGTVKIVSDFVQKVKTVHPSVKVFLDPVMGDNQRIYVPTESVQLYKDMIPFSDVIFPNGFEAELLSDIPITDLTSALLAIDKLHSMGAKTVIITSVTLEDLNSSLLHLIASSPSTSGSYSRFKISFPKRQEFFTGTGDLFASLILGYLKDDQKSLGMDALLEASEKAIGAIQCVLEKTSNLASSRYKNYAFMTDDKARKVRSLELCLVQSKSMIENPPRTFRGVSL